MTDDGSCEGGLLVFACSDGRLVHTQRLTGAILAHDGDAVHAVTALVKGTRLVESCRRLLHQSLYLHHNFTESPLLFLSLHLTHADGKVWAVCLSRGTCAAKRPRDSILPRAGEDLVVAHHELTQRALYRRSPVAFALQDLCTIEIYILFT